MQRNEIDLRALKRAVDAVLDHIVDDAGVDKLVIEPDKDYYWDVPAKDLYSVRTDQPRLDVGRLADDWEFVELMLREKSGAVGAMLMHLAPLLRRVGEKVGR